MRTDTITWQTGEGWTRSHALDAPVDLVLYFGDRDLLASGAPYDELVARYPDAHILGCSTGGQIHEDDVSDELVCALVLKFSTTTVRTASTAITEAADSHAAGARIGTALAAPDLAGIFVLSDGLNVNGSALVAGMTEVTGARVPVSGGLAGDRAEFSRTLVGCDGRPDHGQIGAVGFYGSDLRIGNGCAGGWDVFGPTRKITRSDGNVLFEVDGHPALDLYKLYLGDDDSQRLPGSALLFPMRVHNPTTPADGVVRTILGVDEASGSMTFAGDVPEGWSAQLMRGSIPRLCDGAALAALHAIEASGLVVTDRRAAIMVSCIGRRLLMGQRISAEIEAANAELGANCTPTGFYSFGEISPDVPNGVSHLHNQTMTITVFGEAGPNGAL